MGLRLLLRNLYRSMSLGKSGKRFPSDLTSCLGNLRIPGPLMRPYTYLGMTKVRVGFLQGDRILIV